MRIALAHATYWPEVRRGSERLVHDLGATLATRGHEVTLLTSHRSRRSIRDEGGVRVVRRWRPPRARALSRYEMLIESAPGLVVELLRERFDLVHAFSVVDGWAAGLAGPRLGGLPVIFSFHGIPTRRYLVSRRYRLEMITAAIDRSAATTMLSDAAAEVARRYL